MVRDEVMNVLLNKNANEIHTDMSGATDEELRTAIAMCKLTGRSKTRIKRLEKEMRIRKKDRESNGFRQWTKEEIRKWNEMRKAAGKIQEEIQ